jgi:hypothetical protein
LDSAKATNGTPVDPISGDLPASEVKPPKQPLPDLLRDAVNTVVNPSYGFNANKQNGMKPIAYEPLSGIAVFPVLRHTTDKALAICPICLHENIVQPSL